MQEEKNKKIKLWKIVLWSNIAYAICWIVYSLYIAFVGIFDRSFDYVSPPIALYSQIGIPYYDLFFRFLDDMARNDELIFASLLIFVPLIVFIVSSIYIIKNKEKWLKAVLVIISNFFILLILDLILALTIPALIQMSIYNIKAKIIRFSSVSEVNDEIKNNQIITDIDKIVEQIGKVKDLKVYADYTISDGIILANILNKNKKYTYFESLYLPIYLSGNRGDIDNEKLNNAEVAFLNGKDLIFNDNISKDSLKKVLFAISDKILKDKYADYMLTDNSNLKLFSIIDEDSYAFYYKKKVMAGISSDLIDNIDKYKNNKKIIDEYPGIVKKIDAEYQKTVVDQEKDYNEGCIVVIKYNDCTDYKKLIENNKIIISNDRLSALNEYNLAIKYNTEIADSIKNTKERIIQIESGNSNYIENNMAEYSVGVAFGNDTIYLKYFKDYPISSEYLRILVHELLHNRTFFADRYLPNALNEGLTDYFATRALNYSDLDSIRTSGYVLEIQVIYALLEKIPEKDLLKIYFNQNEKEFEALMKKYFPDVNYSEFIKSYNHMFEVSYHVNGEEHSFERSLIDNDEVIELRLLLGLPEKKFDNVLW